VKRWVVAVALAACLAQAVQSAEASDGTAASAPIDRTALLQRQWAASQERLDDLARTHADARRLLADAPPVPPVPVGLLARDDLRRQIHELDAALAGDARRVRMLKEERASAEARLAERVAAYRGMTEATVAAAQKETTRLEMRLAEASVAELKRLADVLALQQDATHRRRTALAARLDQARPATDVRINARDAATVASAVAARRQALQQRLSAAIVERARAKTAVDTAGGAASRSGLPTERLANADIELDLTRDAMTALAIEEAAWDLALRFEREGGAAAVIEAREKGPRFQQRLQRRAEFLEASTAQVLERIGAWEAGHANAPGVRQNDHQAMRGVLEQRLRRLERAALDSRRVAALLDRLREDLEIRLDGVGWKERLALGGASAVASLQRLWRFELFTVDQSIDVEGRKTTIARSITVEKIVRVPLLLLAGMFASYRLVGWLERRARRRGVDEARARLVRRWSLGVLACGWTLASLGLAGIPLAAFAFAGGAVAIGLGFGTQNLFKNLICGILVLFERPFRLGDVLEVGGMRGTVVDIDLRTSVLRDADGTETLIPNATLVEQSVRNLTFRSGAVRQSLAMYVDSDCNPRAVIEAMQGAALRHGQLLDGSEPRVQLDDVSLHGLYFVLTYWLDLKAGVDAQRIASDLRLMVLGAFDDLGIRLARASLEAPVASRTPRTAPPSDGIAE